MSDQHLKPPSAVRSSSLQHRSSSSSHGHRSSSSHAASSSASSTPRAPLSIHPSSVVADTAVLQGIYQIAIGAGSVIHPRARLYSFEGPLVIGDGCIIGEKCVIGSPPPSSGPPMSPTSPTSPSSEGGGVATRLSSSVTIAPLATVLPGAYVRSSAVIDSLATVNRNAVVGAHSKVCSGCEVSQNGRIDDWTVVWGSGVGFGQRRRKRVVGTVTTSSISKGDVPDGRVVEDARLLVLHKEKEALVKLIGMSAGGSRKR
ncbi:transferase hexapeptide domain protein [Paecilomyces variotii No. 5]|uniref:Dynactin subunit 6 n=1 Tax=Byssochlamys spectabilis (strain No. 5 / NBRC 109023) TaxID=1356009 RepID=V5F9S5_BYSSN|nr:transferase hexapeptide domain protein [Paecilomyces variotii No. 5]